MVRSKCLVSEHLVRRSAQGRRPLALRGMSGNKRLPRLEGNPLRWNWRSRHLRGIYTVLPTAAAAIAAGSSVAATGAAAAGALSVRVSVDATATPRTPHTIHRRCRCLALHQRRLRVSLVLVLVMQVLLVSRLHVGRRCCQLHRGHLSGCGWRHTRLLVGRWKRHGHRVTARATASGACRRRPIRRRKCLLRLVLVL